MDSRRLRQEARSGGRLSVPRLAGAALVVLAFFAGCALRAASPPPLPVTLSEEHVEPDVVTVRHKVAPGQTLYRIARAYGVSSADLMEVNGIEDPRALAVGQELLIPGATEALDVAPTEPAAMIPPPPSRGSADDPDEPTRDGPPVPRGKATRPAKVVMAPKDPAPASGNAAAPPAHPAEETSRERLERALARAGAAPAEAPPPKEAAAPREQPAAGTAQKPSQPEPPGQRVARADPAPAPSPAGKAVETRAAETKAAAGHGPLEWPLRGVLYARFGKKGKEPHDGIDLAAPEGSPVRTAAEGTVLFAGEQKGYGLIAIVEHDHGLITLYAHNRDLRVKTGQKVRSGQVIATVGESGRTSGPHLHFEVRKEGIPVDPLELLGPVPPR